MKILVTLYTLMILLHILPMHLDYLDSPTREKERKFCFDCNRDGWTRNLTNRSYLEGWCDDK